MAVKKRETNKVYDYDMYKNNKLELIGKLITYFDENNKKMIKIQRRERDSNPCTLSRSCFRDSRLTAWLPRHLILEIIHNKTNWIKVILLS